jgi:hypothetical protein
MEIAVPMTNAETKKDQYQSISAVPFSKNHGQDHQDQCGSVCNGLGRGAFQRVHRPSAISKRRVSTRLR